MSQPAMSQFATPLLLPHPTTNDLFALAASFTYSFLLLAVAEAIRIILRYDTDFTRKVVHIGAGCWVWAVYILFDTWQMAIIPFATYIVINFLTLRFKLLRSMDPEEGATPGTVYFCFSITVLFFLFRQDFNSGWPHGHSYLAITGIMAMTFGDALASIIGRRAGKHSASMVPFADRHKTIEGSWACFVAIVIVEIFTIGVFVGSAIGWVGVVLGAFTAAIVGTWLELISPWGTDNLTVPFGITFVLWGLGY